MIRTVISGAGGRMGKKLIDFISNEPDMKVVAALEFSGHPEIGKDAGEAAGCGKTGIMLKTEWSEAADVLIDFSSPLSAVAHAAEAAARGTAVFVGTTGLTADQRAAINKLSTRIPVLVAANTSVGVNLVFKIAAEIAASLGDEYDIEIVEAHHRFKKDAPSGTALKLAEEIAAATGRNLGSDAVYGRKGTPGERTRKEIGIHAVRAGDIVGTHTVIFSNLGESIELTHRAHTRDTFARGAIRAAKFLAAQKPGVYSMKDVVG